MLVRTRKGVEIPWGEVLVAEASSAPSPPGCVWIQTQAGNKVPRGGVGHRGRDIRAGRALLTRGEVALGCRAEMRPRRAYQEATLDQSLADIWGLRDSADMEVST